MALEWLEADEEAELPTLVATEVELDATPHQQPTLTDTETAQVEATSARRAGVEWIMSGRDDHELPTLETLLGRPVWMQDAFCRGLTPVFFSNSPVNIRRAKAICAACPVQAACLAYAMNDPDLVGTFGGTTDRERRELRKGAVA